METHQTSPSIQAAALTSLHGKKQAPCVLGGRWEESSKIDVLVDSLELTIHPSSPLEMGVPDPFPDFENFRH